MRPRAGRYIVICMRKVRAPQGRVPDNVRRRRLQGQCNRDIPPRLCAVRLERRGKSSPAGRVTVPSCKPHPVQDWNGSACAFAQKWLPVRLLIIARVRRQRRAKIDGRTPMHIGRQNPAYCLLICFLLGMLSASPLSLSTDGNIMGISKIIMRR